MTKENPVLDTLRKLIEVNGETTMAEIVSYSSLPKPYVLEVLHKNLPLIIMSESRNKIIVGDRVRELKGEYLRSQGAFWHVTPISYGAEESLTFDGRPDLFEELSENRSIGAYGNSARRDVVMNIEENRQRLRDHGMVPLEEVELTDELWQEDLIQK